jgi:hypothetical protein
MSTGILGLAILAPAMRGGYNCYGRDCDAEVVLGVEVFGYVVVFGNV